MEIISNMVHTIDVEPLLIAHSDNIVHILLHVVFILLINIRKAYP